MIKVATTVSLDKLGIQPSAPFSALPCPLSFEFEWRLYYLSESEATVRARTYSRITYIFSPVMLIT